MKTFKVKVWTKKAITVDIDAESAQEAEETAKTASAFGEFENEDFEDDDFGVECLGEVKDYEIEVMVPVKARFKQKACNAEDAITTVKAEIATGSFDLALLTDYDKSSAQVMYTGTPEAKHDDLLKKYKDLCVTGAEETFVRLWNHFIAGNQPFVKARRTNRPFWELYIHENTLENLKAAFGGVNTDLLDAIFDNDNDEGIFCYSQDARWFTLDGDRKIICGNSVDDIAENIISGVGDCGEAEGSYTDLWKKYMKFCLDNYKEEEEKRMEEIIKQNRKEA